MIELKNPELETAEGRAAHVAEIMDDLKAEEIVALDMRGVADFADFFLIATMRSASHMRSTARKIHDTLRAEGLRPFQPIEDESPRWTILDYGVVVVHLFDAEARQHYRLDLVWGDAGEFDWREARKII